MDWLQEPLQQLQWGLLHWLAGLFWAVDRLLLIGGVLIHSLRRWITDPGGLITLVLTQLLQDPTGSQLIKTYIAGGVLLALLLAAFWFFLRPLLGTGAGAPVDVRKVFLWLALAGFLFGQGPAFASDLERFRAQLSSGAYQVAVQVNGQVGGQGYNNTGGEVPISGSQPFSPTVTLFPQTTHVYGLGNPPEYTGIDVAAAYLLATQEDINGTANGGTGLPGGAEFAYFTNCDGGGQNCAQPWPSGYDEANRQAALAKALNGVIRMATGIVPAIFAVLQAFIFLALAVAAAILFFSLPLSLMFAFFNTTEVIALSVVRAYISLLIKTYITAMVLALFMGFLLYWGGGNWVAFLGMSLLTVFFTWHLAHMSIETITQALNVVTQAMGQAMGVQLPTFDPPKIAGQVAGLGATVALAVATGGVGVAAGSLVSGAGGLLGLPGAGALGTALAVGARRRSGETAQEELERAQPAGPAALASDLPAAAGADTPAPAGPAPMGIPGGGPPPPRPPVRDGRARAEPPSVDTGASATVIDGEWYEIRAGRQRRERANHWLQAQGIAPLPVAADPLLDRPEPLLPGSPPTEWPVFPLPLTHALPAPAEGTAPTATPATVTTGAIPPELAAHPQWTTWRWEEDRKGILRKAPYDPTRADARYASSRRPHTWGTLAEAQSARERWDHDGLNFMLTGEDPFVGIDLDDCRDPEIGALTPEAQRIIARLGSYTEVTPSGTGVRIFVRGHLPPEGRVMKNLTGIGSFEVYDGAPTPGGRPRTHAISVTGQHLAGTPTTIEDRQAELDGLHAEVFSPRLTRPHAAGSGATPAPPEPPPIQSPPLADTAILDKARGARNGTAFRALWQGDTSDYASASEADLALAGMLAFYTQDAGQIERLLRQSGLWDAKWENRPQYRHDTIQRAIQNRTGTYSGRVTPTGMRRRPAPDVGPSPEGPGTRVAASPPAGPEPDGEDVVAAPPTRESDEREESHAD